MKFFTVHENPAMPDPDDRVLLVKEGPIWPAFFAPVLWLLYKRAWFGLVAYVLAAGALLGLLAALRIDASLVQMVAGGFILCAPALLMLAASPLLAILGFVFAMLCAYEAGDIHRFMLARRGYRLTGVVSGRTMIEAEQAYFSARPLPGGEVPAGGQGPWKPKGGGEPAGGHPGARRAGQWASASEPILGLFPGSDRHG